MSMWSTASGDYGMTSMEADPGVKPCGCDSSHRCLDCATDAEVLAAIPDYPSS